MGRVIWINGPFSAGKTTVAGLLVAHLHGSFLLDPEVIGQTLRDHLVPPAAYPGDFQDLALWRSFTRLAVLDAADSSTGAIVVPMTVARREYFDEIVVGLRDRVRLDHYTLMARRETILAREARRADDTGAWAAKTVDRVLPELSSGRYAEHIEAETQSPQEIAAHILTRLTAEDRIARKSPFTSN